MAEFQLICLDEEDLKLVDTIIKKAAGVFTIEDALKWALKASAAQLSAKPAENEVGASEGGLDVVHPAHLQLDSDLQILGMPLRRHIPLDDHHTFAIVDIAKEMDKFEHRIVLARDTFERLVPDKAIREKLLSDHLV